MDERIGRYEGDTRILPKKTLSGGAVTLPVLNTISLGRGMFAVLDMFPPARFDIQAEADKLRASIGGTIQPRIGERLMEDAPVRDVGFPITDAPPPDVYGTFSNEVPGDSDVSGGTKRSK